MNKRTGRQSLMTDTQISYFSVIGHTFTIFLPIAKVLHSITSEIYILLSVCINDLSVKQKLESNRFLKISFTSVHPIPFQEILSKLQFYHLHVTITITNIALLDK